MQQLLNQRHGILLRDVLPDARFFGDLDVRITSCCDDSRVCREGDLFVAQTGASRDGHEFAHEAVSRGAAAILAERPLGLGTPLCLVDDTREAYGRICQALANNPSEHMAVIGVTGTNGKTVTSRLITSILAAAKKRPGYATSIGCSDGEETNLPPMARGSQPEVAELMARMTANGCHHAVLEVSSRTLAQRRASGIGFAAAVLTNIRRDHLDYHGSVLNYRRAKGQLLELLRPEGFVVINADDAASQRLLSTTDRPVITIGMRGEAEVTGWLIERCKSEQTFLLTAGEESVPVRTGMIGDHHIYNCLSAAATSLVLGIELSTIARGLEQVESVPGRLERIECGQPFGVFVDAAQSPDPLSVNLRTLRQVTKGRVICVFGVDDHRDPENRPLLGKVVERGADLSVITSNQPDHSDALRVAHDILDGYQKPGRPHLIPNREKAICWALAEAAPGDSVLIAGKGCDVFPRLPSVSQDSDDRHVARRWLYEIGARTDYAIPATHSLQ